MKNACARSNALAPGAADAFNKGGFARLRRVVFQTTLLLGMAMVLFCAVVLFSGETLMDLLYDAPQYHGHGHPVTVLALAMLAVALGMPAANGLMAVERADVVFKVALLALTASVVLIPCLVLGWGLTGAAYGFLAGSVVGAVGRWTAFSWLVRERGQESVARVLRQLTQDSDESEWVIEPINEGAQASIFTVRRRDGRPLWQTHDVLAVKLYKSAAPHDVAVARRQFESLAQLHAALNGHTINDWKICVPAPVYQCERPLALVMTLVPGRSLNSCLETADRLAPTALETIAGAVVAVLDRYWKSDARTHGDLNFDNILCDPVARSLSFVDPGVLENVFFCDGVSRRWHPASRDLAYLLYDTGVSVKRTLGNAGARRRQQWLVEMVLRAYLKSIAPTGEKHALLDEIHGCVQVHLKALKRSWSPRGLWHGVLRRVARRRINNILGKLRAEDGGDIRGGPGDILLGVFETLDGAGIPYCVTHGYEGYPRRIKSDVDCLISAELLPGQLARLLHANRTRIGACVVRTRGYSVVLAGKNADGSPCFVHFDFDIHYQLDNRRFYTGSEVLRSRRRYQQFWIPAVSLDFGCYLVRRIAKGHLDEEQGQRLSNLYQQDPAGCREQVARFWGAASAALIVSAADSGNWQPVQRALSKLRGELRRRVTLRRPWQVLWSWLCRLAGRVKRGCRPDGGLDIVFLGPDGAGKSSVVRAVRQALAGAFSRTTCYSFPPALLRRLRRGPEVPDTMPHASPPRSFLASALRAVLYWFVHSTLGYFATVHLALARSRLVLHDRHLVDTLVDPRRYRYGGPGWLLRLIWKLVPKPHLVILLDAPAEVLQARKQEVPFTETARQRDAYLALVAAMNNAHVVDAARPREQVVADVNEIILRQLTTRTAHRLGMEQSV